VTHSFPVSFSSIWSPNDIYLGDQIWRSLLSSFLLPPFWTQMSFSPPYLWTPSACALSLMSGSKFYPNTRQLCV
jgi:hypothetical protein